MSSQLDDIMDSQSNTSGTPTLQNGNRVAGVIGLIGWCVIIFGILGAIVIVATLEDPNSRGYFADPHPLRWVYGVSIIVSSGISGMLLIGFGEIIKLLNQIKENTSK